MSALRADLRSLATMLLLVATLAACGGAPTTAPTAAPEAPTAAPEAPAAPTAAPAAPTAAPEAPTAAPEAQPITIRIMTWHGPDGNTAYYEGYKTLTDAYTAANPNVTFEFVYQPLDGYKELLDTQFVAGSAPEIIHMQPWMINEYANKGVLHNLNNAYNSTSPYVDGPAWIASFAGGEDTFAGVRSSNKFGGIFFVPSDSSAVLSIGQPFYYNKDLFRQAGLDPENPPQDWEQFRAALAALKDAGVIPIAADNGRWVGWSLGQVGYQFGERYVDQFYDAKFTGDRGLEFYWDKVYLALANGQLTDAEYYGDMLSLWKDYAQYWQEGWTGTSEADAPNLFMTGQAALLQSGFWDFQSYSALIGDKFEWGVFPVPVITSATSSFGIGKYGAPAGTQDYGFTVNAAVESDPALAAAVIDFLQYMTSLEAQTTYVGIAKSFSPVVGVPIPDEIRGFIAPEALATAREVVGPSFIEWGDGAIWPGLSQDFLLGNIDQAAYQAEVAASSQEGAKAYVESMLGPDGFQASIAAAQQTLADLQAEGASELMIASQQRTVENLQLRYEMMQTYYTP
jgi:ABC-type glycerol-3-phosphate transport system substrate-binding protein